MVEVRIFPVSIQVVSKSGITWASTPGQMPRYLQTDETHCSSHRRHFAETLSNTNCATFNEKGKSAILLKHHSVVYYIHSQHWLILMYTGV